MRFSLAKLFSSKLLIRAGLRFIFCAALLLAGASFALPLAAQDPEIKALSAELDKIISKTPANLDGSRIALVIDFSGPGAEVTELGAWLADQISLNLARTAGGYEMVDHKVYRSALEQRRIPLSVLQKEGPASCSAQAAKASLFILGTLKMNGETIELLIKVFQSSNRKKIGEVKQSLSLAPETKNLAGQPVVLPKIVIPHDMYAPSAEKFKSNGPKCIYCPAPEITHTARSAGFSGSVILRVTITADGHTEDISVITRDPCGLADAAVQAVKEWRFKPATKSDGSPMALSTAIEVAFKLN